MIGYFRFLKPDKIVIKLFFLVFLQQNPAEKLDEKVNLRGSVLNPRKSNNKTQLPAIPELPVCNINS